MYLLTAYIFLMRLHRLTWNSYWYYYSLYFYVLISYRVIDSISVMLYFGQHIQWLLFNLNYLCVKIVIHWLQVITISLQVLTLTYYNSLWALRQYLIHSLLLKIYFYSFLIGTGKSPVHSIYHLDRTRAPKTLHSALPPTAIS